MTQYDDVVPGREGAWMHTNSGKRFFPLDPRPEDICMNDIANGLAMDCRYAGQGLTSRYYSVAEHSVHMAEYAWRDTGKGLVALATLLHDAAEAYLNDLPRAVKKAVDLSGGGYSSVESRISAVVWEKYNVDGVFADARLGGYIKDLDRRIVPLEKEAICRHKLEWAYDQFEPLVGATIQCWNPYDAKREFAELYYNLCHTLGLVPEGIYAD